MPLERFSIVDSTLREGEQFARAHFTTDQKKRIAAALDRFGVEYIELTNPAASPRSFVDAREIAALELRARVVVHCRCTLDDARLAVATGVPGVNVLYGASAGLRAHGHGRSVPEIIGEAREVLAYLREEGVETRFSCEDAFRTPLPTLLEIYRAVDTLGVDRVGVADTVGVAEPRDVERVIGAVREAVGADIEFHGHDDAGCAVANAHAALRAGATHVDTTVLGIGERNGITALGGLVARLYATDRALLGHYDLRQLPALDRTLSEIVGVPIPWNAPITGETAFSHKAGIHAKAVLADPRTYEALDPADFGLGRTVAVGHRLTGWHAVADRARRLGLALGEGEARAAAREIKRLADDGPLGDREVDGVLRACASDDALYDPGGETDHDAPGSCAPACSRSRSASAGRWGGHAAEHSDPAGRYGDLPLPELAVVRDEGCSLSGGAGPALRGACCRRSPHPLDAGETRLATEGNVGWWGREAACRRRGQAERAQRRRGIRRLRPAAVDVRWCRGRAAGRGNDPRPARRGVVAQRGGVAWAH